MAAEVRRLHPAAHVESVSASALTLLQRLAAYDLLIDATGHNPLALRINHEAMIRRRSARQFPPVLHVSVHGNGAAVQSVLVTDDDHACLKCLRPDHGTLKASPLRQGVEIIKRPAACGDGGHIPYAAPAPAMAAALALQAALEWAADPKAPGPRVRTRVLAPELTSAPERSELAAADALSGLSYNRSDGRMRYALLDRWPLVVIQTAIDGSAFAHEVGGVLLGAYRSDCLHIVQATPPQGGDRWSPVRFWRSPLGHQEIAHEVWRRSERTVPFWAA